MIAAAEQEIDIVTSVANLKAGNVKIMAVAVDASGKYEGLTMDVTEIPGVSVSFASSDSKIAKVTKDGCIGVVKGTGKPGTTVVSVVVKEGKKEVGRLEATVYATGNEIPAHVAPAIIGSSTVTVAYNKFIGSLVGLVPKDGQNTVTVAGLYTDSAMTTEVPGFEVVKASMNYNSIDDIYTAEYDGITNEEYAGAVYYNINAIDDYKNPTAKAGKYYLKAVVSSEEELEGEAFPVPVTLKLSKSFPSITIKDVKWKGNEFFALEDYKKEWCSYKWITKAGAILDSGRSFVETQNGSAAAYNANIYSDSLTEGYIVFTKNDNFDAQMSSVSANSKDPTGKTAFNSITKKYNAYLFFEGYRNPLIKAITIPTRYQPFKVTPAQSTLTVVRGKTSTVSAKVTSYDESGKSFTDYGSGENPEILTKDPNFTATGYYEFDSATGDTKLFIDLQVGESASVSKVTLYVKSATYGGDLLLY